MSILRVKEAACPFASSVWPACAQYRAPLYARDGSCCDLSRPEAEPEPSRASYLSLSTAERDRSPSQSHLGRGYHLRPCARNLAVSGGDPGLVFALRHQLGLG